MQLPVRKKIRLETYDYNSTGYYFVTLCTRDRAKILCEIVGRSLPEAPDKFTLPQAEHPEAAPYIRYHEYGKIAHRQLEIMASFYREILLEKYVVMPNHIHLLLRIPGHFQPDHNSSLRKNAAVSQFVGTFKRFCNRQIGQNIWQTSFHDHIIRGEADYQKIWMYIETNPARWERDCFYRQL